ncbi:aluminum-activated malate transporter 10-like [Lolium rigidum]|uniref:aluminum-activated malate transporter 10-like n=1 Tax=Lolium rigidum TaxID=89674 RepID=UPI001F5C1020|nr:aluminum-activated malate transporter 10-like [Lolium rigidum]
MAAGAAPEQQDAGHGGGAAEWRVNVPDADEHDNVKGGTWRRSCCSPPSWSWLFSWMAAPRDRVAGFGRMVWKVGADDPRRVVHGLKVALALTLCSVFYYVHPLYDFTGGNAMWAVLTVVVVFEYTVGACLYKGLNRAMATVVGGSLALGVHWAASRSGKELQPYVLTGSMFLMTSVATFSRFIPTMKAKFDYGVTVFILTYCLVSVSGYRADEIVYLAQQRLTTVAIGAFICFAVCAFVFPVWAGQELHLLVARNMDKLAAAAEGCVEDYFSDPADAAAGARRALSEKSGWYKLVLNAKANEDSLANLARWEPGHGKFGFRHPYGQYQKVGAAMRCCAYCVDALAACVGSESQTPPHVKKHLAGTCLALSRHLAAVLREASGSVTSMTRSGRLGLVVADMNAAAQDLRDELRCLAAVLEEGLEDESSEAQHELINAATPPLIEALPLFSAASLLLEVCARAEGVVGAVETLATTARFKKADHDEKAALDTEASVPVCTNNPVDANVSQEIHVKIAGEQEKMETGHKATVSSGNAPRDQVGELIKVLMRRRSSKKWSRADTKVSPKPPLDLAVTVPSPRNRAMELAGHGPVGSSPRNRPVELAGHPTAMPSPRNRAVEHPGHAPAVPSPRIRSMDFASHGPAVPSPRNRSMDFAAHAPGQRSRSILGMA